MEQRPPGGVVAADVAKAGGTHVGGVGGLRGPHERHVAAAQPEGQRGVRAGQAGGATHVALVGSSCHLYPPMSNDRCCQSSGQGVDR